MGGTYSWILAEFTDARREIFSNRQGASICPGAVLEKPGPFLLEWLSSDANLALVLVLYTIETLFNMLKLELRFLS